MCVSVLPNRSLAQDALVQVLEIMQLQRLSQTMPDEPPKRAKVYVVGCADAKEWLAIAAACSDSRWKQAGGQVLLYL